MIFTNWQACLLYFGIGVFGSPSLEVPSCVPESASQYVDPDFPGFAFEQASLTRYALDDDGNPNAFSQNLIEAIISRTGGKPLIRLGGTSADVAWYLPDQVAPALPVAEVDNYQDVGGTTIGPTYWDLCKTFPNAQWIIQTPLAITNVTESIIWAQTAAEKIGLDKIQAFEPGNEPDLYPGSNLGPPEYLGKLTNETYASNFSHSAAAIGDAVKLPAARFFQAFDLAARVGVIVGDNEGVLDVEAVFNAGIDANGIVKTVAHHYYQTNGGNASTLASGLMTHSTIASRLDLFRPAISWLKKNKPEIPYIISEIGNSLNPKHDYAYQATLGSALWQVDFQLYALAIGIARFNFQQIMHSGFDLWLPVASAGMEPQVYANFYAQPFVTELVGDSGKAQVAELQIDNEATRNWAAYAVFVEGTPVRLAILNMNYWNRTSSTNGRASQTIAVKLPGDVRSVKVDLLTSPEGAGAKADSMTYAGSQWTYESLGKEVKGVRNDSKVFKVACGLVHIEVFQSSAMIAHLVR